jgi:AcrR family transcriptional regulator
MERSMSRNRHGQQRREAILAAGRQVFDACGYAAATMDAVAAQAGISKGSIYNYFQNKQDLFIQVIDRSVSPERAAMRALTEQPIPAAEKLNRIIDRWVELRDYGRDIGRLILEFWATAARDEQEGELTGLLQRLHGEWAELLEGVIAQGIREGRFSASVNPELAAALYQALTDGMMIHTIMDIGVRIDAELIEAVKRGVLAALAAGAGGPDHGR